LLLAAAVVEVILQAAVELVDLELVQVYLLFLDQLM
jgi:hypothetical protein